MGDDMFLFNEMKKCVKEKKAIVIVGAGVSIAATGNDNASWKGLLKMGIERCIYVGSPRPKPGAGPICCGQVWTRY